MKITCPDCKKKLKIEIENGYVHCDNCLQMVLIENKKPIKTTPKDLML